jgi:hypothetical protein
MFILNQVVDVILAPFRQLPPEVGVAVYSILLATIVLVVFKVTSRPERVARARSRAVARILEMWLYRDDPWVSLGAFGRLLLDNARYLGSLLIPMLASLVPVVLLLVQAHDWFAARPLRAGESTLLVARVREDVPPEEWKHLETSVGGTPCVRVDSPAVRAPAVHEVVWRLRANERAGCAAVTIADRAGAVRVEKAVCAGYRLARVSASRTGGRAAWLLAPGEPRLPASQPFARIDVLYPAAEYNILGLRMGWLTAILVLSLPAGLALKRPLRVEF